MKVGIDMEKVSRMSERLLDRIATESEREYVLKFKEKKTHIAGLWCAKEATIKMLGERSLSFLDIEILHLPSGEVKLNLLGKAKEIFDLLGLKECALSISHTRTDAIAIVIAK